VYDIRLAYVGDPGTHNGNVVQDYYGGGVVTGWGAWDSTIYNFRFRVVQMEIDGGWYTVGNA
jgi:hypothetical protein